MYCGSFNLLCNCTPIILSSSWSAEAEQAADGHRYQLGWRAPPRQEV